MCQAGRRTKLGARLATHALEDASAHRHTSAGATRIAFFGTAGSPRSGRLDSFLNVVRSLTDPELDDAKVSEIVVVERIFLEDGLDFRPTLAHGQDDPAISRYL